MKTIAIAASLLLLGSCAPEARPPLRLAASVWPGYEGLYLARDLGYFDEHRVVCFELPTSSIAFEAFRNGSIDVTAVSLNEYFELLRGGARAKIIAVLDRSNGGDAAMVTPAVHSLTDLRGKRVVLPNFSFVGNLVLGHLLDEAHLQRADIALTITPEDRFDEIYRQHQGDVFITFEPHKSRLAALGAHVLYDSSRFPDEIVDVLVARDAVAEERREEVCDLARQWFRALEYIRRDGEDAYVRMGRRNGQSARQFHQVMNGLDLLSREDNLAMLAGSHPRILESAKSINQFMLREKYWSAPVDLAPSLLAGTRECLG